MTKFEQLDIGTQTLLDDLRVKSVGFDREELIRRTLLGRYHDFKTNYEMPKVMLDKHLRSAGYTDLAEKCRNGVYDQQKDAADEWQQTDEFKEVIKDFIKGE